MRLNIDSPPPIVGDKYQRIIDAAVSLFAQKGFHTECVSSDVADRAFVADGTIYLYFRNKKELPMTAINTAFDAFMSRADAVADIIALGSEK